MKASEHLDLIHQRVAETHWAKGALVVDTGPHPTFCLLGLMHWTVIGDTDLESEWDVINFEREYAAYSYLVRAIEKELLPEDSRYDIGEDEFWDGDIITFNDDVNTKREDILRVVERAKELAITEGA